MIQGGPGGSEVLVLCNCRFFPGVQGVPGGSQGGPKCDFCVTVGNFRVSRDVPVLLFCNCRLFGGVQGVPRGSQGGPKWNFSVTVGNLKGSRGVPQGVPVAVPEGFGGVPEGVARGFQGVPKGHQRGYQGVTFVQRSVISRGTRGVPGGTRGGTSGGTRGVPGGTRGVPGGFQGGSQRWIPAPDPGRRARFQPGSEGPKVVKVCNCSENRAGTSGAVQGGGDPGVPHWIRLEPY